MFAALGTETRLQFVQRLLAAHPQGMVVGEIQAELDLSGPNLSHHLDKLKGENLVRVEREGTFLRYRASVESLQGLLGFLYAEFCTRSGAINPKHVVNA